MSALAGKYKANPDVVFVSLARDDAACLKAFLTNQKLRYAVVPNSGDYRETAWQTNRYPAHFVVDKEGKVVKVASPVADLPTALAALVPPPGH